MEMLLQKPLIWKLTVSEGFLNIYQFSMTSKHSPTLTLDGSQMIWWVIWR